MRSSDAPATLRSGHTRAVLETLVKSGETSRAALSKALSLSKPAVSDILSGLLEAGLVIETGAGSAAKGGGRKPTMLSLNSDHRYMAAVDLSFLEPVFAVGDIACRLRAISVPASHRTQPGASPEQTVLSGLERALEQAQIENNRLDCVLVSAPGVFDAQGRMLAQNPKAYGVQWSEQIKASVTERFGVPVYVMNDDNAAALGEWSGAAEPANGLLYVSCGTGLGAGLILNGRMHTGWRFRAGEIYSYGDSGMRMQGETAENRLCMAALLSRAKAAGVMRSGDTFPAFVRAYEARDERALLLVDEVCRELAAMILNYAALMDVEQVVFGGEYRVFGERFMQAMGAFHKPEGLIVRLSALGREAGIHGLLFEGRQRYFLAYCAQ